MVRLDFKHLQAEIARLQEQDLLNPRAWVQGNRIKIWLSAPLNIIRTLKRVKKRHFRGFYRKSMV